MFLSEKNTRKKILSWITAAMAAVICVDFICMLYVREPGGIERSGGPIYAASQPGKIAVNCEEGYGFNQTDENGYTNTTAKLSEGGYILILGNSMTRGSNVMPDERYVQQLNKLIADDLGGDATDTAYVYSISRGGALFAELASGYDAALAEFPNAKAVVIQLVFENRDLRISPAYLEQIYNQREFDFTQTAEYIFENEDAFSRVKHWVKNTFPLIPFAQNRRINKIGNPFAYAFGINWKNLKEDNNNYIPETENDIEVAKRESLVQVLAYLNSKNDIPIILVDLPEIACFDENSLAFNYYDKNIWVDACDEAGVTFIGMSDEFENLYSQKKKLPYGFSNTEMGTGHLNKDGCQVVAETIYKHLKELEVIE